MRPGVAHIRTLIPPDEMCMLSVAPDNMAQGKSEDEDSHKELEYYHEFRGRTRWVNVTIADGRHGDE